jgi:hypothetical protein
MFLDPIRRFAKGGELSAAAGTYLRRLEDRARGLAGQAFPLVLTHGDFSVSNILLDVPAEGAYDRAVVSVIDWTKSLDAGLPLRDLWHLLTAYAKGLTPQASSGRIMVPGGGSGAVRWLDDYCERYLPVDAGPVHRFLVHLRSPGSPLGNRDQPAGTLPGQFRCLRPRHQVDR